MSSTEGLGLQEGSSNVDKRLGDLSKASLELQHCSTRRVRVRSRDRRVVIAIVAAYLVALWIFLSIFKPTERRVTNGGTGSMEIWQNLLGWIPRLGKSSATPGLVANPRSLLSAEDLTHINRLHWLSLGMFASLGVVQTVTTYVDADSSTREMNIVTTGLSLIGCICYLTLATSSGPMFHSSAPGRFIYPTRLLTWLFSTSLLHYATWVYGEKPLSYLWRTLGFNATMLMAGVVCSLCTGWLMWAGFLVSASSFLLMGCCKYQMFGMEDIEETKRASHAISRLKFVIGAIWCVFPAAWILQFSPLSSVAIEAIVIMADVASKAVMLAMQKAALMLASDRRHVTMMQLSLELIKDMQEQEKRKEGFFTAMTNELRTPMKSIVDMLESVLQQKASLSDKVLSTITNVRDAGQRFSLLISTILDASSVKASRLRLQPKPVNIRKIIDDVAVLIEPLMCSNTKLEIQVSRNLPAVDADPIRLSQVLFNILGNAAKFTPSGKITVAARIDLGGIMRIKVKDTGIGIEHDKQGVIFKPFEQLDNSINHLQGGMGLGLSLAHSLVEAHGGRLVVSSEQGKGSTFTILIPLKSKGKDWKVMDPLNTILPEASSEAPETSPVSPKREEPEMSPVLDNPNNAQRQVAGPRPAARGGLPALSRTRQSMDIRKPTRRKESLRGAMRHSRDGETIRDNLLVEWLKSRKQEALSCMIRTELADKLTEMEALVVDDKQVNQVVIGELLSSSGFKVTPVLSGEEVLSLLVNRYASTGTKDFPDLIIMDLMAPGMNGNQVTGQIRTLYPQCPVPIIMVGSNIDQDSIVEALQVGCTDYITKPIQPTELLARVGLQLDVLHQDTLNLEAKRREALLQELLPESVIQRLKDGEELVVDELKEVTILHADVPDFDQLMAEAEGKDGFIVIDNLVKRLDALVELHGMYKVEANGHTYIAVAGLDMHSRMDQCSRTIQAAIDFLAVARDIAVDVRVGVHTGPALGGVLGAVRPRYVLFGETVKAVAEVMKSTPRNCCQASHATYVALGDEGYSSNFHDNGKTAEFGKEKLKLWLLECGEYKSALAEFLPSPVRKVSFKRGKRWRRMWTQGTPPGYKG